MPDHQFVGLQGPDAIAFAQAQFANDLAALAPGHWQWSAWLSAKGRVLAIFMLCRVAEDELLMVLADGGARQIAEALQRFVFRRKLTLGVREDLHATGAFRAPAQASGARLQAEADAWEFDLGAPALPRTLRVSSQAAAALPGFALAWRQADLRLGLPRLDASAAEQWTPQQIGLDRLAAYSVRKGCYPGQEIVARTHFLGKAKRVAQLVRLPDGAQPGNALRNGNQPAGTVASVAGELALAVLPIESQDLPLSWNETPVALLPMLDGLAR